MELKHLIVRYRYLKFFVEAFEQSIIADDSADTAQQELYLKFKQAKTDEKSPRQGNRGRKRGSQRLYTLKR